jgi:hypothetical protein
VSERESQCVCVCAEDLGRRRSGHSTQLCAQLYVSLCIPMSLSLSVSLSVSLSLSLCARVRVCGAGRVARCGPHQMNEQVNAFPANPIDKRLIKRLFIFTLFPI